MVLDISSEEKRERDGVGVGVAPGGGETRGRLGSKEV